jgi:hypothetical protein
MRAPRLQPTVTAVELDGELVLYQAATGRVLHLDGLAAFVLACCNGRRAPQQIARDLQDALPAADPAALEGGVAAALAALEREGVVA